MTRFKLFSKRKSPLNHHINKDINIANSSSLQDSILPCYSTVNSNANDSL